MIFVCGLVCVRRLLDDEVDCPLLCHVEPTHGVGLQVGGLGVLEIRRLGDQVHLPRRPVLLSRERGVYESDLEPVIDDEQPIDLGIGSVDDAVAESDRCGCEHVLHLWCKRNPIIESPLVRSAVGYQLDDSAEVWLEMR